MEYLLNKQPKIRFSGVGDLHQNWSSESAIERLFTMKMTILMHDALICPKDTLYTNIFPIPIYYAVCVCNQITNIKYGLSTNEVRSSSIFQPVSENLRERHVWGCPTYVQEPKL